jgi:hypothetical protein
MLRRHKVLQSGHREQRFLHSVRAAHRYHPVNRLIPFFLNVRPDHGVGMGDSLNRLLKNPL